jgi:hypothetical protein
MKTLTATLIALLTFFSFQNVAYAATSEVTWTDYEKYRDIRAGNNNRKSFRERTFKSLEEHFSKLAEKLPEGQVLKIEVTDVDLAGDTLAGGMDRIRIVKEIYSPRMNFSYQLVNADGSEILKDEIVLKDMNFMRSSQLKYRNDSLGYEKKMLDDWFYDVFEEHFAEKK